ncbi:MAG: HTTM domain-containing protein [Cyclobacteriaceae bacterium]
MILSDTISKQTSIAPLITFRVLFGLMMAFSVARFTLNGWIDELYISPQFHFSYYGFEWVEALPAKGMYILFGLLFVSALLIASGYLYRVATVLFFVLFTYVELIDKTTYLNHYYFISLVAFIMIFLPANRRFALDISLRGASPTSTVPAWTINIIRFQLFIVYFYAGLAKLNADWLLHAQPLKIWLPAESHLPLIGPLLKYEITAYIFSWAGAAFDILVPFLLLSKKIRPLAYFFVIIFHALTAILFPIGMFPFIMTLSALIFFSATFHERIVGGQEKLFRAPTYLTSVTITTSKLITGILIIFCVFNLLFPWRYLLYPGNLFWTEEGYRFSWRVMLMEKMGNTTFKIKDSLTNRTAIVANYEYLTPLQEREMNTQPDMILQFAHFLAQEYKERGFSKPEVTVDCKVTLNGKKSQVFIDPNANLAEIKEGWSPKDWIKPYPEN